MSASITFTGFSPEHPTGRSFSLWRLVVPQKNRIEDQSYDDARRVINCMQEVTNLLLIGVDRFTDLFDPDVCSDAVIDDMLIDMGNPFTWAELELTAPQRRKLLRYLIEIYRGKGTARGIESAILFLLGVQVTIVPHVRGGWVLGIDELGEGSIAEIGNFIADPYSFVSYPQPWTVAFSVNGDPAQVVTFVPGDFANTAACTVEEILAVVDAQIVDAGTYIVNDGDSAVLDGGAGPFALSGGEAFKITIQGVSHEVVFRADEIAMAGAATMDEVVRALHALPGVVVAPLPTNGNLAIRSLHRGSESSLLSSGDASNTAAVPLGIGLGTAAAGVDGKRFYVYSEMVGEGASIECISPGLSVDAALGFWGDRASGVGGSILSTSTSRAIYSFDIKIQSPVDAGIEVLIRSIANYMKAAHEHLVDVRLAPELPWPAGWVLGAGKLDDDTELTE